MGTDCLNKTYLCPYCGKFHCGKILSEHKYEKN